MEYALDRDAKGGLEMDCGGRMSLFIEYVDSNPKLLLVGGGHVSLAVAKVARLIGFRIIVVENRQEFAGVERFPFADTIVCDPDLTKVLDRLEVDDRTYVIVLTGGNDELALRSLLRYDPAYLGMMGSRKKVATILGHLRKEGFPDEKLRNIFAPIGLDLGAETPEELAISVLSEVMKIKAGRDGTSLAFKTGKTVVVRGGGDLATGVAHRLFRCGFQVAILEVPRPTVIRRTVSFAQAVYDGAATVEGVTARKAGNLGDIRRIIGDGEIPVFVDESGSSISSLKPKAVVDAIMAKKNLATHRNMAPIVIGLGPGFKAGEDVDVVIETNRGHNLGKAICQGEAEQDTRIPGAVEGFTTERLIRACCGGVVTPLVEIGERVAKGSIVVRIGDREVAAPISGIVRGMVQAGTTASEGMKIGDIDPRERLEYCRTISDKARSIAGGVLEAYLSLSRLRPPTSIRSVPKMDDTL